MTYRIEITADSLTELAGRVAALAVQLQASTAPLAYVAPVVVKDPAPARTAAKKIAAQIAAAAEPVAEPAAPVAETAAPVAEPVAVVEPTAAEPSVIEYDLIADVNPRILAYVKRHSREAVEEILAQFGAARASEVPVAQRGELVAILDAALNA